MLQPRNLTGEILNQLGKHEIIFLLGTRQTGKTTLTRLVADSAEYQAKGAIFTEEIKSYR